MLPSINLFQARKRACDGGIDRQFVLDFVLKNKWISVAGLLLATQAFAADCGESSGWLDKSCRRVSQIWSEGQTDIYIPGYAYHLRSMYSAEKIASFNEHAWGFGMGKSIVDEDGDWQGLYAMAFLDSHNDVEPIAGYAYQKMLPLSENWQVGGGFTAFLTSRSDTLKNFPVPGALPLVSLQYRQAALMMSYMPGSKGNGNILFFFTRFRY